MNQKGTIKVKIPNVLKQRETSNRDFQNYTNFHQATKAHNQPKVTGDAQSNVKGSGPNLKFKI